MEVKKSKSANLENKKGTWVLMGLVAVFALLYVAFEWTQHEKKFDGDILDAGDIVLEEEVIPITMPEKKTVPPPPQAVTQAEVLNSVEDDAEIEETTIASTDDQAEFVEISEDVQVIVEEVEEEQQIFQVVENMPEFPGGTQALLQYLKSLYIGKLVPFTSVNGYQSFRMTYSSEEEVKDMVTVILALALVLSMTAIAGAEDVKDLPRNETLYFAGQQWGSVNSWNVIGTNQNNSMAIAGGASGYRTLVYETLYMYNFMNGELVGLLANNDYAWNDDMTAITLTIKDAAKWSDGTPVTAADVVRTFDIGVQIGNGTGTGFKAYIASIEAVDEKSLKINAAVNEEANAYLATSPRIYQP